MLLWVSRSHWGKFHGQIWIRIFCYVLKFKIRTLADRQTEKCHHVCFHYHFKIKFCC